MKQRGFKLLAMVLVFASTIFAITPTILAQSNQQNPYTNSVFAPITLTATSQTSPAIRLSPINSGTNGSFNAGNITVTGNSLSTATFAVLGSSDGGQTYFNLNINSIVTPGTLATTATVTANGIYQVNLAGITNIKIVTSGTFTATSVTFQLTASPNGLIARTSSGGSGSGTVVSFSSGSLNPLFTTSVANPTTTPTQSFSLTTAAQNSVFAGPSTGGTGAPLYRALVAADLPVGSSTAFGAVKVDGTTITASGGVISAVGGGSPSFSAITSGTNTNGLVMGSGGVLSFVTGGFINANELNGTVLSGLSTGILKNTTSTGVPTIAAAGTDYVAPTGSSAGLSQATTSAFGVVKPDGSTITISGGVISAASGSGTVTHTTGALTALQMIIGNGTADVKVDTGCATNGSGTLTCLSYATNATYPGNWSFGAGTGSIPALPANSAGFAGPVSGGTAYLLKMAGTATAGVLEAAAPGTVDGVNESALSFVPFPWTCQPGVGDGVNAITGATYLESTCYNDTGKTVTLTGIKCFTDNNGTSTLAATNGAGTALIASAGTVTCSNSFAAATQSSTTTIASGDFIKFSFTADGTSKQSTFVITGNHI